MKTEAEIKTYRVDDIPLLIAQQRKLGLAELLDEHMNPHGNRQGLRVGWMVVGWLSYILSQADHRLSYVESWSLEQEDILQKLIPAEVSTRDFTDDRLGDVLIYLSDDESWSAIEASLGQRILQVYEIPTKRVHLDSTSAAVYHSPEGKALIKYGYSKDHRPDLAQLKVMMGSLAPMGMPLATLVVPGNQADDDLYVPVIKQSRKVLNRRGLLYIGDSKKELLKIRVVLAAGGDFYLTPLSKKGTQTELLHELLEPVWSEEQELTDKYPSISKQVSSTAKKALKNTEKHLLGYLSMTKRRTIRLNDCWPVPSRQLVTKKLKSRARMSYSVGMSAY